MLHWNEETLKQHEAMGFQEGWSIVAGQLADLAEGDDPVRAALLQESLGRFLVASGSYEAALAAVAEGVLLGAYAFGRYRVRSAQGRPAPLESMRAASWAVAAVWTRYPEALSTGMSMSLKKFEPSMRSSELPCLFL